MSPSLLANGEMRFMIRITHRQQHITERRKRMEKERKELLCEFEQKIALLTTATKERLQENPVDDSVTSLYMVTLYLMLTNKEIFSLCEDKSFFANVADSIHLVDCMLTFPNQVFEKFSVQKYGFFGKIKQRISVKRFVRQTVRSMIRQLERLYLTWEMATTCTEIFSFKKKQPPQSMLYLQRTIKALKQGKKITMPTEQDLPFLFEYLNNPEGRTETPAESTPPAQAPETEDLL